LCQCFAIASVESTIVPSISNSIPAKLHVSGGAEKALPSPNDGISEVALAQKVFYLKTWRDLMNSKLRVKRP